MATDYFEELKKQPYPLYVAPRPYSFDLNKDMINMIRDEFNAEGVASGFAEAIKEKEAGSVEKIGKQFFEQYGQSWMKKTMQLGEEFPDRTMEVILEAVDRRGNQFLFFPYIPQRFVEIAYLSTQQMRSLPIIVNSQYELVYRVPNCFLFDRIKAKCGKDVASLMICKNGCLKALHTIAEDLDLDVVIGMAASNAKKGYCEFSMKKL